MDRGSIGTYVKELGLCSIDDMMLLKVLKRGCHGVKRSLGDGFFNRG